MTRTMRSIFIAVWTGALALTAPAAFAADTLQLTNEAFLETEAIGPDGQREIKRVPAALVVPGTEVTYRITYQNVGEKPADNAVITNPIPEHMVYTANSAQGEDVTVEVSVDGGKNYGELSKLRLPTERGTLRLAKASDVTHLRFRLGKSVNPGEKNAVRFKARLK